MPGADKNWNAKLVLFKDEVTEGTDSLPAVVADAYRVLNYQPTFMDADGKTRDLEKAFFGADPVALANFKRGAAFDMELIGGGAATTPPPWMKILQYCGFGVPAVGASAVTQSPITGGIKSATHYVYIDDLLTPATGTRGGAAFTFEDDDYPRLSLNVLGIPNDALATQQTPPAVVPIAYQNPVIASTEQSSFLWGGYAFPLRRWTMSDNAQLALRSFINPKDRVKYGGRSWSGEIVIKVGDLSVTNGNPFPAIRTGATKAATAVHGTTAGNIVQIDAPALQISGNVALSEEEGEVLATFPVTALPVSGNDEIVFTTK